MTVTTGTIHFRVPSSASSIIWVTWKQYGFYFMDTSADYRSQNLKSQEVYYSCSFSRLDLCPDSIIYCLLMSASRSRLGCLLNCSADWRNRRWCCLSPPVTASIPEIKSRALSHRVAEGAVVLCTRHLGQNDAMPSHERDHLPHSNVPSLRPITLLYHC